MGVSKFFRWMSERYPFVLQLVEENRIPQFDNLYLDMNGIIHHCSHPNEGNAHFRITEAEIFLGIFSYLEHLFALAKPQKVFFLAVDGVAPRAKMNQQRARRFKTARETQQLIEKAIRRREKLPETGGFDSNCITPGTPFMARLSEQLKYFINKKVSEDSAWQTVQVIFSGHDVPGEGEHKIMEYIRLSKAQEDYDPNLRHCVYGLDADLIMLALLSHDPHFCLLREEVKFSQNKNQSAGLEDQRFYLLHISLVRDYLDWEFACLKAIKKLEYDLERIIDDFILLCIFVGNDFLPHLPHLHINDGALGLLFDIYKKVLPQAGGYLNESGTLNTQRLQLVLDELVSYERENFEHVCADSSWIHSKQPSRTKPNHDVKQESYSTLSDTQRTLLAQVESFVRSNLLSSDRFEAALALPACYPAKDRKFLRTLASELDLCISFDEFDENDEPLITLSFDSDRERPIDSDVYAVQDMLEDLRIGESSRTDSISHEDQVDKVFRKYNEAAQEPEWDEARFDDLQEQKFQRALRDWKSRYYSEKMQLNFEDPDQVGKLTYAYTEGLQWVLHYYYDGVASWSWFYPYHYSPMISDLDKVASYSFSFDLGEPFKPFEQLMGVLPELSSAHVPPAFRDLMSNSESPIIDLYPRDFETDLNGKKHDWEAIVKIPFIDQERLLKAMKLHEPRLLEEERNRNKFGPSWQFRYDPQASLTYSSSLPGFFPDLHNCHSQMSVYDLPTLGGLRLIKGLCKGVLLGKDAVAGFPSLHNLPHIGTLKFHKIKVHQSESRSETIVIEVQNIYEGTKAEDLAKSLIDSRVFVGYPFLREAKVTGLSDNLFRYQLDPFKKSCRSIPHDPAALQAWQRTASDLEYNFSKKCGLVTGPIDILVHAKPIKGLKRIDDDALVKEYETREDDYALQLIVMNVSSLDPRFMEQSAKSITEDFPEGSKVFFLDTSNYGAPGQVMGHLDDKLQLRIMSFPTDSQEIHEFRGAAREATIHASGSYLNGTQVSQRLQIGRQTLAKITSSLLVHEGTGNESKVNIGLSMKFVAKSQKVLGYTRKIGNGWEYSSDAFKLIEEYQQRFPEIIRTLESQPWCDILSAAEIFPNNPQEKMAQVKSWIKAKGIRDFQRVSLESDSLDSATIAKLESIASKFLALRSANNLQQAGFRNVPRRAVLKPSHAEEKLGSQTFELGDRVVMVSDRGTVPLSAKGVVVGITDKLIDVVFDGPFIGGTNLSNRCKTYQGATLSPGTVLNLTNPQFCQDVTGAKPRGRVGGEHLRPAAAAAPSPSNRGAWQKGGIGFNPASSHVNAPQTTRGSFPSRGRAAWGTMQPANPNQSNPPLTSPPRVELARPAKGYPEISGSRWETNRGDLNNRSPSTAHQPWRKEETQPPTIGALIPNNRSIIRSNGTRGVYGTNNGMSYRGRASAKPGNVASSHQSGPASSEPPRPWVGNLSNPSSNRPSENPNGSVENSLYNTHQTQHRGHARGKGGGWRGRPNGRGHY